MRGTRAMRLGPAVLFVVAILASGCRDLSGFSTTNGDVYEGPVVNADFVLAGMAPNTQLCLTLDTNHLQDLPGDIWTSDGTFDTTPMRPIPQIWHDPLSTLSFGEGRVKNLVYVAASSTNGDVFVVVSLMESGGVEVRLLRGAPGVALADGGATSEGGATSGGATTGGGNLFAVFELSRQGGPCSF